MDNGVYDEIMAPHNGPGKCVSLILKAMIGTKTLSKCTRTGRVSNRKINKLNDSDVDETENDEKSNNKPEKLDETKLNTCFDLYVHWLKNHHNKVNPVVNIMDEMTNFNTYLSSSEEDVVTSKKIKIATNVHGEPGKKAERKKLIKKKEKPELGKKKEIQKKKKEATEESEEVEEKSEVFEKSEQVAEKKGEETKGNDHKASSLNVNEIFFIDSTAALSDMSSLSADYVSDDSLADTKNPLEEL